MGVPVKHENQKFGILIVLIFELAGLQAQETIPASGGNAGAATGTASYSVGQVFSSTTTGTGGSVLAGVQQPYEISVVSGIEVLNVSLRCSAYPNPVTGVLILKMDGDPVKTSANLFDAKGKLLRSIEINKNESVIDLSGFVAGIYFINVFRGKSEIKTFKIIKK